MARCDIGKTIIDELRLCYTAEQTLLQELSQIEIGKWRDYENFSLFRVHSRHFQYSYDILYDTENSRIKVATLRFGHYGEPQQTPYVYYRIENHILYNHDMLVTTLTLPDILGFTFQHITSIDLTKDFKFNVVQKIRKIAKESNTKVIKNGKVIDKTQDISGAMMVYTLNFTKIRNPSICLKQAKAEHDKTKGLTLCAYNKRNEIETESHKNYILDFYENPKTLHRLEVHQNNQEIKDFCKNRNIVQDINLIFNQEFLDDMYYTHLSSILRFTKGRNKQNWHEILQ